MFVHPGISRLRAAGASCVFVALASGTCFAGTAYVENFLASDGVVNAPHTDSNLINPWGAAASPTGPIWIDNQGKDNATLYDGAGNKQSLTVDIPFAAGGGHGPTGVAFNPDSSSFNLSTDGKTGAASFIFANLDGSIDAWNSSGDKTKATKAFTSATKAAYTGLTLHTGGGGGVADDRIYAVDAIGHKIDVLDSSFNKISTSGSFSDPSVPSGLFPFNVAAVDDKIYIAYAPPGKGNDDAPLGSGALAVFDLNGNLIKHIQSGGQLATPWAITKAPSSFGDFSNALLVGNFSEDFGQVNAFDESTGKFLGTLNDKNGKPIRNPYQWAVLPGNGTNNTDANSLYITAGPEGETRGVFAKISVSTGGTSGGGGGGGGGNAVPLPPALLAGPIAGVFAFAGALRTRRKMLKN